MSPAICNHDRQMGDVFCEPHERDVFRVMNSLVESGSSVGEALVQARSSGNKKHIRTSHPSNLEQRLKGIYDSFKRKSDACVAVGGKPFFLCVV